MTRSSSKSLPPLGPVAAAHASTSSDASLEYSSGEGTRRSCVTNNCIRTTVSLFVFAAYIAWTWPWYLEHGADDIGLGRVGHDPLDSDLTAEGVIRAPPLGVPESLQTKWAQYSPWHPLQDYAAPPAGCEINQVSCSIMSKLRRRWWKAWRSCAHNAMLRVRIVVMRHEAEERLRVV